jgi:glycosyltransferase involved in cell wall biosynthesis
MVSFTKGEGFGRPLLEFSLIGKPIIASNWSGHLDFLKKSFNYLVDGELENVHPSAANDWLIKESKWFKPNDMEANLSLRNIYERYDKYKELSKKQAQYSKSNFSYNKMKILVDDILNKYVPDFPKKVSLNLPKLELPKLTPIK